jgi:hypothetical protein
MTIAFLGGHYLAIIMYLYNRKQTPLTLLGDLYLTLIMERHERPKLTFLAWSTLLSHYNGPV